MDETAVSYYIEKSDENCIITTIDDTSYFDYNFNSSTSVHQQLDIKLDNKNSTDNYEKFQLTSEESNKNELIEFYNKEIKQEHEENFSKNEDIIVLDLSWLPDYFNVSQINERYVEGYVKTSKQMEDLLEAHSDATLSRFYLM